VTNTLTENGGVEFAGPEIDGPR